LSAAETLRPGGATVAVYYIHSDQLNTPRQVTRPSDNKQMWTWFADPFGTTAANSNPAGAGAFPYNLRFPGQVFDGQAGLHQNYFRDYDPATGRYPTSDPIGLAGGLNTYSHAYNSPLRTKDARGLATEEDEEEAEENAERWESEVTRTHVDEAVDQIRQYDPGFRYATLAAPGYRYSRQDLDYLNDLLAQYRRSASCPAPGTRINYGTTPAGLPFSRH
jgi:RHS repeat-associated protein